MKHSISQKTIAIVLASSLVLSAGSFAGTGTSQIKTNTVLTNTKTVNTTYGGYAVTVNNKPITLLTASAKTDVITYLGTTYVPLKPVAENLGYSLTYNSQTKIASLKTSSVQTATSQNSNTGVTPPTGTPPTGNPPTGNPPTGNPPTGNPPTGNPPTGTPPAYNSTDATTSATQSNHATQNTSTTTTNDTSTSITKTTASTQKLTLSLGGIAFNVYGKVVTLKDSANKNVSALLYNNNVYVSTAALPSLLGVKVTLNTTTHIIGITGTITQQSSSASPSNLNSTVTGTAIMNVNTALGSKSAQNLTATLANQSGLKVTKGGSLTLSASNITKSGDSTTVETSNFTGLNAGILVENSGQLTLNQTTVKTSAEGSNAIVATGDNSKVEINGITIETTGNSSRGLHATYNGTIIASEVNIHTTGNHSGALTTDRGEGTVTVTGGSLTTEGEGSPGIYSTGNITASNITSTAKGSEAAVIEGKNSITLNNAILSGAKKWGVMIYQSFSGDAGTGTGTFTMTGGSITAAVGPMFYSTNTNGVINLNGVALKATSGILLQADGNNQWGTKGSNGANLTLNASNQALNGSVNLDSLSTLALHLTNASTFNGTLDSAHTAKSLTLTISSDSTLTLTGDSYVTTLTDEDASLNNIHDQGHNLYYDANNSANSWLGGKTITLSGGGQLMPR